MDGSDGATSDGGELLDAGAADDLLDLPDESDVGDSGTEERDADDAAPSEKSKPKTEAKPAGEKKPEPKKAEKPAADKKGDKDAAGDAAVDKFEKISGLRVHKEDADRLKNIVKGAYGAFQKAAQLEQLLRPENREKLFEALKIDPDSFAAERLSKRLNERLETPEEKAQREATEEIERLRNENKAFKQKEADAESTKLADSEIAKINREWPAVFEKIGLPKGRAELVLRAAQIAKLYLTDKHVDLPIEHIAELVKDERDALGRDTLLKTIEEASDEDFDAFMKALPEKASKRVRGWFVAQVKRPPKQGATPPDQPAAKRRASKAPISPEQFHEQLGI